MVKPWSTTLHSQIFTAGINGGSGTTGASCLACHTVGYDTNNTANDGGFAYLMQQLKWTFPTTLQPGNWNQVPTALQNVANIQCENCHGPGSQHTASGGDTSSISIPQNTGQCNQCHDDPTHHFRGRRGRTRCMPSPPPIRPGTPLVLAAIPAPASFSA
jgi:hypothetical protein